MSAGRLVLSESRFLRYLTFTLFYISQGVPAGVMIIGVPAWAAASGASSATVASLAAAPYLVASFKFLMGPFLDRYTFPAMGRRRPWVIGAQSVMTLAWVAAATLSPGPLDTSLLVLVGVMVGVSTAVQDVAADALSVDLLQDGEEGPASAFMFGGAIVSMAASGAASGYLLQHYGSSIAFLAFLPVIGLVTLYAILILERPGERRFPWSEGEESPIDKAVQAERWWPILREAVGNLLSRDSLIFVVASLAAGLAAGLVVPLWPLFATQTAGYDATGYTALNSAINLPVTFACVALGGVLNPRLGVRNVVAAVLLLDTLMYVGMWLYTGAFASPPVFIAIMVATSLTGTLRQIGQQALRIDLSTARVGATQMTIYNSLGNFTISTGAALFAALGGIAALDRNLAVVAAISAVAAVLTLLLRIGGRAPKSA
jgi:PAT family beta-lactamase induction signal transducer AmpG